MINGKLNKELLQNGLGLSCIENYLLYAFRESNIEYSYLFYNSFLSFNEIFNEFYNNHAEYASFYRVPRLNNISTNNFITEFSYQEDKNFMPMCNKYDYILITVKHEFIEQKYKTKLWREDHYILLSFKDELSFYFLNDIPRDDGIVSTEDVLKIYNNEAIGFSIINSISDKQKERFIKTFYKSLLKECDKQSEFPQNSQINLIQLRDTLGLLRVLERRIKMFCNNFMDTSFMDNYIKIIDQEYTLLEYKRLRKKNDCIDAKDLIIQINSEDKKVINKIKKNVEGYLYGTNFK